MRLTELFAGVSGFGQGAERAGMEVVALCEVDADCQDVNRLHYPDALLVGDVTKVSGADLPPCDVLAFGSPCQDLSVAGKRKGLEGERSGLFHEAVRVIRECRERHGKPEWVVWENVPGALSSNGGRDFAAVVRAFRDAGALDVAWRVLDGQWFGVPQRRRRVFIVCDFGGFRAGEVLFEPEGVRGDPAAGRAEGEDLAGEAEGGPGSRGAFGVDARNSRLQPGGLSGTLQAKKSGGHSLNYVNPVLVAANASEDGTGRGTPLVPVGYTVHGEHSTAMTGGGDAQVAFETERARSLDTTGGYATNQGGTVVAFAQNQRGEVRALRAGASHSYQFAQSGMAVRRLMPVECEKLMGWEPGWTALGASGKRMSDSVRYRMCGNGIISNVAEWICRRIMEASR